MDVIHDKSKSINFVELATNYYVNYVHVYKTSN